jgi:uncharacterized protein with HEPN domain
MPRSIRTYLADVQLSIEAIEEYTQGKNLADIEQNRMLRSAVRGELMIIGEAISQMLHHFPETSEQIKPARRIVDFRNLLIHEYGEVDDSVVWSTITSALPILKADVNAWITRL